MKIENGEFKAQNKHSIQNWRAKNRERHNSKFLIQNSTFRAAGSGGNDRRVRYQNQNTELAGMAFRGPVIVVPPGPLRLRLPADSAYSGKIRHRRSG